MKRVPDQRHRPTFDLPTLSSHFFVLLLAGRCLAAHFQEFISSGDRMNEPVSCKQPEPRPPPPPPARLHFIPSRRMLLNRSRKKLQHAHVIWLLGKMAGCRRV